MSFARDLPGYRPRGAGMFYDLDANRNVVPLPDVHAYINSAIRHGEMIQVGLDMAGSLYVSTIFLGVNTSLFARAPQVFETAGGTSGSLRVLTRHGSWAEALAGHRRFVALAEQMSHLSGDELLEAVERAYGEIPMCEFQDGIATVLIEMGAPADEAHVRAVALLNGHHEPHKLGDAGMVALTPDHEGRYMIVAGLGLDPAAHTAVWRYEDYATAKAAFDAWDGAGDPAGFTGRWVHEGKK